MVGKQDERDGISPHSAGEDENKDECGDRAENSSARLHSKDDEEAKAGSALQPAIAIRLRL